MYSVYVLVVSGVPEVSVVSEMAVCVEMSVLVVSSEVVVSAASDTSGVVVEAEKDVKAIAVISFCSTVTASLVPMLLRRTS